MKTLIKYLVTLVLFLTVQVFHAQEFKNDEDRLKYANELFEDENYIDAAPHMLHFLSLNQTSGEFNFKYGVCVLKTDEDKSKSIRYLRYAAKQGGVDKRVYFFLGEAYHLNYLFNDAIVEYQKFKSKADSKIVSKYPVDLHIKMCANGQKLMRNLTELVVSDKKESSYERFQYSYDLSQMGGKILVSEEFQSKYDKKLGYRSLVYFPPLNQNVIFYSSYGKDGATGLDLYQVKRLPNGDWSEPQKLPEHINTAYDDAYAYLHPNGTTFYFCSKGHTSMGGYDVFKCSYDIQTNTFGPPINQDYKINTPDDDIMYVVDSLNENAYFASSRAAKGGYLDVYKVRVEVFPLLNVILAGDFINEIVPSDINASIKVENTLTGVTEGIYNPNKEGKYVIVLPKSGRYKLIVETPKSEKIHSGIVDIPPQKKLRPLKQEILLVNRNGEEQLIIRNLFDEEVEGADAILAQVMKNLADPEVNADDFPDSVFAINNNAAIDSVLDDDVNFTKEDLISMSTEMAQEAEDEAKTIEKRMNAAYSVANSKSKSAADMAEKAQEILKNIDAVDNPLEKQQQIELANEYHKKSKDLNQQATTSLNLANKLEEEYNLKNQEAIESRKIASDIESALNEDSHEKAVAELQKLKSIIENIITTDSSDIQKHTAFDKIVKEAIEKQEEADKALADAQQYRKEQDQITIRLKNLRTQYDNAKEKDKPDIQNQITLLEEEYQAAEDIAKESFAKNEKLQKEADELQHQADLLANIFEEMENSDDISLSAEEKSAIENLVSSSTVSNEISTNEDILASLPANEVKSSTNNEAESNETNESNESENNNSENNEVTENSESSNTSETNESNENSEENLTADNWYSGDDYLEYENEVANLDENLSPEEKAQKENEVYEKWIQQLDTDIQEATTLALNSTDPTEKRKNENNVVALMQLKDEKEYLMNKNNELLQEAGIVNNEEPDYTNYENKFSETEDIEDKVEKAKKENQIAQDWVAILDEDIQNAKDKLTLEEDPVKQEELKSQIEKLEALKSEKEELIATNNDIIATNESNEIAENNESTESNETSETNNEESNTSNESTEENSTNENSANVEEINRLNESIEAKDSKIADLNEAYIAASNISDPNQRQIKQQEINNELINELKDKAQVQKELMDAETNESEKSSLLMSINDTFKTIEEKEQKADELNQIASNSSNSESEEISAIESESRTMAASTEDVEKSLTSKSTFQHEEANEEYNNVSEKVDDLNVAEQEVASLKMDYDAETKEGKKEKIAKQLDKKEEEQQTLEIEIAEGLSKANAIEKEKNSEDIATLKNQLNAQSENLDQEKNYITATTLEKVAEEQYNSASEIIAKAHETEDIEEKAELMKEAVALEKAAITNQNESAEILEEMSNETYVADYIDNGNTKSATISNNENETSENNEVANNETTETNSNETNTSEENNNSETNEVTENTETSNTTEENTSETNESSENNEVANTETSETNTNETNTSEENNNSETNEVAENNENSNTTETNESTENNEVAENSFVKNASVEIEDVVENESVSGFDFDPSETTTEVYTPTTNVNEKNVTDLEFNSEAANTTKTEHQDDFNEISEIENEIRTISNDAEYATSEKEKNKIEKKVNKLEKKKAKKELAVAEVVEESNTIENEVADAGVETFTENSEEIKETSEFKQAEEYLSAAEKLQNEAVQLRDEAENVKDKVEKSNLLREAASKEQKAVEYKTEAKKMMVSAIVESYENKVENIETSNNSLSNELKEKSELANEKSLAYLEKATLLRDSANTISKEEEKIIVIKEAEKFEEKAKVEQVLSQTYEEQSELALEKESEVAEKEELLTKINSATAEQIREEEEYVQFYKSQREIDSLDALVKVEKAKQDGFENLAKQQEAKAKALENKAKETEDKTEKEELLTKAEELNQSAKENRKKKTASAAIVEDLYTQVENEKQTQSNNISSLSSEKQEQYLALAASNFEQEPIEKVKVGNVLASDFVPPTKIETDIIQFTTETTYSEENPIPVNPKNPDGLVYKVQVGAFRKPIPQDLFKGFAPISAEKIRDDITRYRVGYFTNFDVANAAKNEIRPMGYPDAFVVAIYNGERITLAEARRLEQGGGAENLAVNETTENTNTSTTIRVNEINNSTSSNNNTTTTNTNNTSNTTVPEYVNNMGEDAAAVEAVEVIDGCFYTVQIGAFSNPIKTNDVFNVSPLVTKYVNGLYKYSTGVFGTIEDANARKNEMINRGLTDAFVTAYCNGEKKGVQELTSMIATQGESILAVDNNGSIKHSTSDGGATPVETPNATDEVKMITSAPTNEGTEYFVDLGTYTGSVPQGIGTALLLMYDYEIIITKLDDNTSKYSCGAFTDKADAERAVQKFQLLGVENAKIVEHQDGNVVGGESNLAPTPVDGLVYRVFLGTYPNGAVPLARSRVFLELEYLGIESSRDEDGDTYYCGKEGLYSDAQKTLKEFMNQGVTIARIVAFMNGSEIDVDEARKLTHEE